MIKVCVVLSLQISACKVEIITNWLCPATVLILGACSRILRGFLTGALALERVDRVNQMYRALGQQPGDNQVKR